MSKENKQKKGKRIDSDEGSGFHIDENTGIKINETIDDTVIEKKLINQLVQSVPRDKIPYTSFSVKRNISKWKFYILSFLSTLFIAVTLFTFNYNRILKVITDWRATAQNAIAIAILDLMKSIRLEWLFIVYIFGYLSFILYKLFLQVSYRNGLFKNVVLYTNTMEMQLRGESEKKESYFDNHLDDILYMFENVKADAVVFEDIERFKNYRIFEQLREINTLVNIRIRNSQDHSPPKTVRFFYLVHDNLFSDSGMVKFFDFIIPVIPALHVKDSYKKLKNHLCNCCINIDDELLKNLSVKIYDYSILKKLINEFLIMYGRFNEENANANEVLAVVIYKNVMSHDYSLFIKGKGQLYNIVDKDKWVDTLVESDEVTREEADSKRDRYNNLSLKELIDSLPRLQGLLNDLSEPGAEESELQLIRYLLNNNYINSNIFHYITQYVDIQYTSI